MNASYSAVAFGFVLACLTPCLDVIDICSGRILVLHEFRSFWLWSLSWALIFYCCRTLLPCAFSRFEFVDDLSEDLCWKVVLLSFAWLLFDVCVVIRYGCLITNFLSISLPTSSLRCLQMSAFILLRDPIHVNFWNIGRENNSISNCPLSPVGFHFSFSPRRIREYQPSLHTGWWNSVNFLF